ncbi:MAG: Na+/H+ antiporter NhaC family protein [Rikenellaceae bacterium]
MLNFKRRKGRIPSLLASLTPLVVLSILLYVVLKIFGSDAIGGANQIALLTATSVCVLISMFVYGQRWDVLEEAMIENIRASSSAIIILLLIGALSGTWMLSGVVPSMIYYGLQILNPTIFLITSCIVCAVVSIMTGSSWTTIATIGIALMGIGTAQGFSQGWIAGAIISGAYFGDKLSMLSDTTVLASSAVGVNIFEHIRYMMITTVPSFIIALTVFGVVGLMGGEAEAIHIEEYSETLEQTFHISPWLMIIPIITGVLIANRLPAIITLFASAFMAAVAMAFAQPQILAQIVGSESLNMGVMTKIEAVLRGCYGATSIITPSVEVNDLISTRGMEGMLTTIWLIICAMCFGGVMTGSGMLERLTSVFLKYVKRTTSVVGSTVFGGIFFNITTADQYISIILTGKLFKDLYKKQGLEGRLLSRSVEDSASVCSVLVPWNSCGMTQATVLGVSTFTYIPYCIFNLVSPLMSVAVAYLGYKIKQPKLKDKAQ